MSSLTDLLETAIKHLDCLTAGQHPFIKEALSELMKRESQNVNEDLSSPQTEIEALRAQLADVESDLDTVALHNIKLQQQLAVIKEPLSDIEFQKACANVGLEKIYITHSELADEIHRAILERIGEQGGE